MGEPEEPDKNIARHKKSEGLLTSPAQPPDRDSLIMDLDLDFDACWSFDNFFSAVASSSASPFLLSTSDHPCSPLWAFSDGSNNNEDKAPVNTAPLSDFSKILPCKLHFSALDCYLCVVYILV